MMRGNPCCDYCSRGLTAIILDDEALKQRKEAGLKGRANFVFNLSFDRRTPVRFLGTYDPKHSVARVSLTI